MAIDLKLTPQATTEIRTHYVDFTKDLPSGVTVSSATAGTVTFPTSGTAGLSVGAISSNAARLAELGFSGISVDRPTIHLIADAIGVGAAVPGAIRAAGSPAVGVKTSERATSRTEIGEFNRLRDQLWWEVREWLRTDPAAMLPLDEELIEELIIATYEVKDWPDPDHAQGDYARAPETLA